MILNCHSVSVRMIISCRSQMLGRSVCFMFLKKNLDFQITNHCYWSLKPGIRQAQSELLYWATVLSTVRHSETCLPENVAPSLGFCLVLDTFSKRALQTGRGSPPSADRVPVSERCTVRWPDTGQQAEALCSYLVADHLLSFQWISIQALNKHKLLVICQRTELCVSY